MKRLTKCMIYHQIIIVDKSQVTATSRAASWTTFCAILWVAFATTRWVSRRFLCTKVRLSNLIKSQIDLMSRIWPVNYTKWQLAKEDDDENRGAKFWQENQATLSVFQRTTTRPWMTHRYRQPEVASCLSFWCQTLSQPESILPNHHQHLGKLHCWSLMVW